MCNTQFHSDTSSRNDVHRAQKVMKLLQTLNGRQRRCGTQMQFVTYRCRVRAEQVWKLLTQQL